MLWRGETGREKASVEAALGDGGLDEAVDEEWSKGIQRLCQR